MLSLLPSFSLLTADLTNALMITLKGMVGIFLVMLLIIAEIVVLGKVTKSK